ncbi:MAG: dockerin type I repeat-containing protein [Dehalococcoidia bacterium]|nr:dockerin type I repeat-containing protein [Dehalococcoidia bacterium]
MRAKLTVLALLLCANALWAAVAVTAPTAQALPPAGEDVLVVAAEVSVTSRLGAETISLQGTVRVERGDPYIDGGVEVVDAEIVALQLEGNSQTGPVVVTQSAADPTLGEIRSKQPPPDQFPASSFFDVFVDVEVPASPGSPITLHNEIPLHVVPMQGGNEVNIDAWPPEGATYAAELDPCVPLLPADPAEVCVTAVSIVILKQLGDVNDDGLVNPVDSALILQLNAGIISVLPNPSSADVNLDGEIDSVDAALILQLVAGLIDSLPA